VLGSPKGTGPDLRTFDVVTTYAERHWESHAKRCVESFEKYWPGFNLIAFLDDELEEHSDWLAEFKARHRHRPTDNYRFDAVRFAHKVAAIELAFYGGAADSLIWMDADCVTHATVDRPWLCNLVGHSDFAYLARPKKYTETGFMVIRRSEAGEKLVRSVVDLYASDNLFNLKEWHDCMAFDHAREKLAGQLRCVSLSGGAQYTGHPLINGPLGERLDHCKGARKAAGRSHQSDLRVLRKEAYWRG
jgi:hypothetical protein